MCDSARALFALTFLFATCQTALANSSVQAIDEAITISDYPLALTLIGTQLAAKPNDVSLLLRLARVHSYVGNYDGAYEILDQLRREYPHDVDYALARARILARQGREREALADLREATLLAPDYEEVWQLRQSLLARQAAQWTVLLGAGHDNLSNGAPSWKQQFIEVSREHDTEGRYRLGIARDRRFDNNDLAVSFGGERSFASNWFAGLNVSLVSEPEFQPEASYDANLGRSLEDGWVVSLRYRHREYATATVGSATTTVEKYVGDFHFSYGLGISHLYGAATSMNHGLATNWYYSDRGSIGVSVNVGREVEAIGPAAVLETDVRGVSVRGRRQLTDRFGLRWWMGLHDQGDFYRRQYFGFAVSIRL